MGKRQPAEQEAYYSEGNAYLRKGDFDQAIRSWGREGETRGSAVLVVK